MQLSAELSLYPLAAEEFRPVIQDFIDRLNQHSGIEVHTNTMSTQVFGEFDTVMSVLQQELKITYQQLPSQVLVCKFINNDLRPAQ
ncbi:YkoF family thiamine/hydroxymethylpyrimidine-binding protein [Idiomarina xiamenensis]|uniref:Thiamine-binding protein domain-containing protein n=1 Tax=Idiomarina xiamenensis 10-D-4 TaxID=740709 RepID=K2L3P5_9GAMM|nr:YkoF family thiamine/hydroxymethylpyrimidine-binding protein [Idiomarina xiamenensis]EKE84485.1 hypothetical protein A10D4_05437 [Idiomarina xiamenensis 10-D-4]